MDALIVLAVTLVLLWALFILPQQRRVRAHQQLVASIEPGDEVILSAGIFGRVVDADAEEMQLEVAPGVVLRVARQAVLRRAGPAGGTVTGDGEGAGDHGDDAADRDAGGEEGHGAGESRPGGGD